MHTNPPNFVEIAETVRLRVRRAAVFLGLGLHSANDPNLTEFRLSPYAQLEYLPLEIPAQTLEHFKAQYLQWVTVCAFREVVEAFGVFLDDIFLAFPHAGTNLKKPDVKNFDKLFLHEKFKRIREEIGDLDAETFVLSLNQARNCLAHRGGIVGERDCVEDGILQVKWIGLSLQIKDADGTMRSLIPMPKEGVHWPAASTLEIGRYVRARKFAIGSVLSFDAHELAEILHTFLISSEEVTRKCEERFR